MKIDITKFQQGGGFAQFTPILRSLEGQTQQTPSKESKEKSSGLMDDDIYKELIKGGGLVNDVNAFVQEIAALESDPLAFTNPNNSGRALRIFAKVNELKNNKQIWTNSVNTAKASGGLGEIAVNSYGEIYARNKNGKIETVHLSEYKKNKDNYHTLTVSELMNARQFDPQLTFDQSVFTVAQNSIGIDKITEQMKSFITSFGQESFETERHYSKSQVASEIARIHNMKAPNESEIQSLELLYQLANTPGDYFKVVEKDSGKRRQLEKGLNYLISSLPKEHRLKLEATAIQNGRGDSQEYVKDLLMLMTPQSVTSNITPTKEPGGSTSGDSSNEKNLTRFQMFNKDKLMGAYRPFSLNDPELDAVFSGTVGSVGPLVDKKDNNIGMTSLWTVMFDKEYNALTESNQIYFGNQKVDVHNLYNVVYDGYDAAKVYMPVGRDGAPDFEANETFKKVYAIYEQNKDQMTTREAEDLFDEYGFKLKIDEITGGEKIIRDNQWVKPFLVMSGYTNSATGLTGKENNLIKELSSNERDNILPLLKQIWTVGTGKNIKDMTPDKSWHREKYYKGIITVPYKSDSYANVDAMVGQGAKEKVASIADVQRNIRHSANVPITTTRADLLNQ